MEEFHEGFLYVWQFQYLDLGKNYKGDHFIKIFFFLPVVLANFFFNLVLAGVILKEGTSNEKIPPLAWQMDMPVGS